MAKFQRTVLVIHSSWVGHGEDLAQLQQQLQQEVNCSYRVLTAASDSQALALCRSQVIECIVFELDSGQSLNFLSQLQKQLGEQCPPIVVIGRGDAARVVQAFKQGATDYLIQGQITPEELRSALDKAIADPRSPQKLPPPQQQVQTPSDRKHTEAALRQSEERYRTLFESMTEGFCVVEMLFDDHNQAIDYRFLEVNPVFEDQTGLHEAEGKTARQLLPNLEPHWFEIYGNVAQTGEPIRFEHGSEVMNRWFEVSAFRVGQPEHRKVGILFKEVSERKRAELKLKQNQATIAQQLAEIEAIYQTAPIGLGFLDRDLRFVRLNQQLAEINGIAIADHLGRTVREIIPDLADTVEPLCHQILATGEPLLNLEIRGETAAQPGIQRTWLEHWFPLREVEGQIIGINVVVQEITERKQAEIALDNQKKLMQQLCDSMPQFVWVCSPSGELEYINQRWTEYSGLTLEQTRDLSPGTEYYHPDDRQLVFAQWAIALERKQPFELEARLKRAADGVYRWFLLRAVPSLDPQGQVQRWHGTSTDITDRKLAEQERERLLAQEKSARAEAERANRIKDEFLAILSHELRSPLNPILGWSRLLQSRNFDPSKTAAALATIERNARVQAQLIDDLLDLAKILRGKLSLNITAVDLALVVEAAIDTVRTAATAKSITLHSVLPNVGQVAGDAARLQQIVWNLLSNAVKFTPPGGRVEIELSVISGPVAPEAQIQVQDTGKGIAPDFLPHIFESFRQEDASITRKYGGLGLGLAIVRQLVEAHGGSITAASPGEGLGATFTVRLPLLILEPDTPQAPKMSTSNPDLWGIRVLAVDDDPDTRELLKILLTEYGAEVVSVTSAAEALAALESFRPHVLISDIGMPEVDGYHLIQQIRALPPAQGGQIPAIALTAYASQEDQQLALHNGYQRHLSKPLELEQLAEAVVALTLIQPTD